MLVGFMDISKIFDCIFYIELLNIFKSLGIVHKLFSLLKPYLYNIKQQVRISNIVSKELVINNGILQGIGLSPLLYIIYVSALGNLNLQGKLFSYTDDTGLIISSTSWEISVQNAV